MPRYASWIETLAQLERDGTPCAMVVTVDVRGSGPRESGSRMLVADGKLVWGTVGGGNLEKLAIERAMAMLASGSPESETVDFPLSEKAGQCCGGSVSLFFETFPWSRRRVVVFGAGHVAQALGGLAGYLSSDVLLIDGRQEEEIQPALPPADARPYRVLCIDAPEGEVEELPADAHVLIMTHDHALDLEILARCLKRDAFPYIGLIGSDRKWKRFEKRLQARGFSGSDLERVTCPIGVHKGSKEPAAIAISTAAELLAVFERGGVLRS